MGITRLPATWSEAQTVLAEAAPQTMVLLPEEYREQVSPSTYGGVEQRGGPIDSAPRQPQAQRPVARQLRQV